MSTTRRPFQPAQWTSQVALNWSINGVPAKNILHYQWQSGVQGAPTAAELGPAIVANFTTGVRANFHTNAQLVSVGVLQLDNATRMEQLYTTGLPLAGTGGATQLPNNCAMVVKLLTLKRGRNYRGRIYVPGVFGQTGANVNRWASAQTTGIANWVNSILTISTGSGQVYGLSIVSRWVNNEYRSTCEVTAVANVFADNLVHTQRRRLV